MGLIGQPLTRREDPPLLTGRGRYVDDFTPPGTLHAFVVRSPLAHARITGIDVTEARAAEGVAAVFTPKDFEITAIISGIINEIRRAHKLQPWPGRPGALAGATSEG